MKKIYSRLLSMVLVIALLIACTPTALAAPSRNKGNVKYLSEVAVIEAANDEEAKKILTELQKEEKGGFEDMITLDLNKGGQRKIYLAYKTSTNVDDAITDLAVMNMEGNFSMGNYEKVLSENMANFAEVAKDYRVMAAEFAANYAAGNINAQTAYRQLNLYYNEVDGVKTYMGDYMLNFPATDEGFAEILFRGNLNIIANLRSLMAMGVGNGETTLAQRIADAYAAAETDPSVYSTAAYSAAAKAMLEDFDKMKKNINNLEAEMAKIDADTTMDAETKEFAKETLQNSLDVSKAFMELLKDIPMGDTTLGNYIMNTPVIEVTKLYPIAAAGTAAELLMMEYHSLYEVLLYEVLDLCGEELEAALQALEADMEPLSVYHGVQNDLVSGTIGVTGDAETYSNSSGKDFFDIYGNSDTQAGAIIFSVLGVGGVASMMGGICYLLAKSTDVFIANETAKAALQKAIDTAQAKISSCNSTITSLTYSGNSAAGTKSIADSVALLQKDLVKAKGELETATNNLNNYVMKEMSTGQILMGGGLILAGMIMMGVSIWQLATIYSKYEIAYTDIPDNMVDVVSYEDGDRFVNYKNVPAYYYEDDKLLTRENDLNAYDGRQWVSLYYTKNYEAGYCLTASPDLIATDVVKSGYTPIHLFGRADGYNTNSYCNRENAGAVYLAFKYSTNQKSAVTDVPEIIGSIFSAGMIAIPAVVGFAAGAIFMAGINKKKAKAAN